MSLTYRVRYSAKPSGQLHTAQDVRCLEVDGTLDDIPGKLPPASYIMYVEDLAADANVHWTRWPKAFRPGFGE